jgi:hypothetical protein
VAAPCEQPFEPVDKLAHEDIKAKLDGDNGEEKDEERPPDEVICQPERVGAPRRPPFLDPGMDRLRVSSACISKHPLQSPMSPSWPAELPIPSRLRV